MPDQWCWTFCQNFMPISFFIVHFFLLVTENYMQMNAYKYIRKEKKSMLEKRKLKKFKVEAKKIHIKVRKQRKDRGVTILFIKRKKKLLFASFHSNVLHRPKNNFEVSVFNLNVSPSSWESNKTNGTSQGFPETKPDSKKCLRSSSCGNHW